MTVSLHYLTELPGFLGFSKLNAGGHDRNEATTWREQLPGMEDMIDILLPGEGRVHDDLVEKRLLLPIFQEVLSDDLKTVLLQDLSIAFLKLDHPKTTSWATRPDDLRNGSLACRWFQNKIFILQMCPGDELIGDRRRRLEEFDRLLDVDRFPGLKRFGNLRCRLSIEDMASYFPIPFTAKSFKRLVQSDISLTVELLIDINDVSFYTKANKNILDVTLRRR